MADTVAKVMAELGIEGVTLVHRSEALTARHDIAKVMAELESAHVQGTTMVDPAASFPPALAGRCSIRAASTQSGPPTSPT